jgi:hypothetical protein
MMNLQHSDTALISEMIVLGGAHNVLFNRKVCKVKLF